MPVLEHASNDSKIYHHSKNTFHLILQKCSNALKIIQVHSKQNILIDGSPPDSCSKLEMATEPLE